MIWFVVAALVAAVILTSGAGFIWWQTTRGLLAQRLRRRVIVTTKTGDTMLGVLYETDRHVFVLRDAAVLGDGGTQVGADGELLIFRVDVAYIQIP